MIKRKHPKVSVGLTVFNGERYLGKAIESFLSQTYADFELIICDNASTDRTEDISREYAAKDVRVRYHRNDINVGLAGNHNVAFELARGEYFKWAADDDLCLPNHFERCVAVLDQHPDVVLAYPKTQFINPDDDFLDIEDSCWDLRSDDPVERLTYVIFYRGHWANSIVGLIRSSALARTRLMPTYPGGDYRVLGELSLLGKFHEIPDTLFLRRLHPTPPSKAKTNAKKPKTTKLAGRCSTSANGYWTGARTRRSLPTWDINLDYFRAIIRSGLSVRQKLQLSRALLRHMRWHRALMLRELVSAAPSFLPRLHRPKSATSSA